MRTSRFIAVAVLGLASFAPLSAQETYAIKFKTYADEGKSFTVRNTSKDFGSMKFIADGKVIDENKPKTQETVYTETVLQRGTGTGKPAKYVRVYEKASETEDGKTKVFSYRGRTVVFERKDNAYRVGVVGTPDLDPDDLEKLIKDANQTPNSDRDLDAALLPTKPVAVGETWKLDIAKLALVYEDYEIDIAASRAEAKLVKIYKKGSSQCGQIEYTLAIAATSIKNFLKFQPPIRSKFHVTIERAIDGSSCESKAILRESHLGKGVIDGNGKQTKVEIDGGEDKQEESSAEFDSPKALKIPAVALYGPGEFWSEYASKEGQFSAAFPGKPTVQSKKNEKSGTEIVTTGVSRENGQVGYSVIYFINDKQDPKALLTALVDQYAKQTKKKTDVKQNGYVGVELVTEIKVNAEDVADVTILMYVTEDRVYQVMAVRARTAKETVETRKFFDSFKLTKKAEAKKDDKK